MLESYVTLPCFLGTAIRMVRLNRLPDVIANEPPGLLTDAVLEVALRGILVVVAQRARDEELGAQAQGLVLKLPGGGPADLALRAELIDGELSEGRAGGARPVHRGELAVVPDVGFGELDPRRGVLDRAVERKYRLRVVVSLGEGVAGVLRGLDRLRRFAHVGAHVLADRGRSDAGPARDLAAVEDLLDRDAGGLERGGGDLRRA